MTNGLTANIYPTSKPPPSLPLLRDVKSNELVVYWFFFSSKHSTTGFEYFQSKFDPDAGELAPQIQLLKLACLCNPIRMRDLHPPVEQFDELLRFKVLSREDAHVSMQGLKK